MLRLEMGPIAESRTAAIGVAMMTFDDVFGAAQGLPPPDRLRLIDALWETLEADQRPGPSEEWIVEAQRRSAECDAGRMKVSTWDEVRSRVRREAGLDE